jgi:hypothetical protein
MNAQKKEKPVDLSEYAEERIPFDAVIRKLGKVKLAEPEKKKTAKPAPKRK